MHKRNSNIMVIHLLYCLNHPACKWHLWGVSSFLSSPDHFYLLILDVEGYCCTWSHSTTHTTLGRTPLDERSARRRDLYLTTDNIHKRQTSMPQARIEPAIPACEWPQAHPLDCADTGLGYDLCHGILLMVYGPAIFMAISSKTAQFSQTIVWQ
jgi:hypothetical protein